MRKSATTAMGSRAGMSGLVRQVSLGKGNHHYVFRYPAGREEDILNAFAELASNAAAEFDWYDAAALAYQIGLRFETDSARARTPK